MGDDAKKLGLMGLMAMVVGSMIGGGIFNISQNMAAGAALGAVIIAWSVTGFGMYFLASTFKTLSDRKPELSSGIYAYAKEGFGQYIGFNSAWGYWISAAVGNVAFAIMVTDASSYFFPAIKAHTWGPILGGSLIIWVMNFIVLRGVKGASFLNTISTVAKLIPLALFVIILLFAFHWDKLSFDFWGAQNPQLGGILKQVKSTMLVTLWCFIGIEGAVVVSGRAKNKKDVGKATMLGFLGSLVVYAAISIFSFGIMNQPALAGLKDPSVAYVLEQIVGQWGAAFINIGLIVSVLGAWIAWTIIVAEVPYAAAQEGVLPRIFARENKNKSPSAALYISSMLMQITILMVAFAENVYLATIDIASVMVLIPYILSPMYLWKLSVKGETFEKNRKGKTGSLVTGIIATIYGFWLVYAAGLNYILLSSIFYAIGIFFYWLAHKDRPKGERLFKNFEMIIAIALVIMAVVSIVLLVKGTISF
jgi:arginine:ornithine antiporter/lysine permease